MGEYQILNRIDRPEDLRGLSQAELELLCTELRDFLVRNISVTGGHLSSNLGVVELTVALHRVLDLPRDLTICAICTLSMPLGLNSVVIPSAYGKNSAVAAGMALVSHLCAIGTIPLIFFLLTKLFGA